MILYFSATGNTKLVAETIAGYLQDETLDLLQRIKSDDVSDICSDRPFVICSPIYVSELPAFLAKYLRKVSFKGSREVYGVFTNGGYSGIAGGQLKQILRRKGMHFQGYVEFKMASNHLTNKSHRELDSAEIVKRTRASLSKAAETAQVIQNGGRFMNRHIILAEYLITLPLAPVLCYFNQGTKGFWVQNTCVACGKCARLCPLNVIEMRQGKPMWKEKQCAHCMSCIQNCPVEAIEYKNTTVGKKRYSISRVDLS